MNTLKSGALKIGIHLIESQLEQFETYYRELVDWNERMNLTAITNYEEVQVKHFLDSLTVLTALKPADLAQPLAILDVGTGAGLPGVPLKIALPRTRLALLEATTKKCTFLQHLTSTLGMRDVEIINARAEEAAHDARYREKFDLVLSRAVASLPALAELTLPFCAVGGLFIAQKKGSIQKEIEQSQPAIDRLGGRLGEVRPVLLEGLNDRRYLIVIDKVKPTPPAYPRRTGMPAKRPLGTRPGLYS
jgi:16S rRNA (guanine527-N7)-methyltransferase